MSTPPVSAAPALEGVLETGVYVAELERACAFYARVLGLQPMHRDARMAAYAIAPGQVLLLFLQGSTSGTVTLPGGTIPPHDGSGRAHYALAIATDALTDWEAHLQACGVSIEGRTQWPGGGQSIYFRDPDAHLLELATPGLWPNY
ncbi:VOC family protein [Xanthomonas floridensis]|uniref:Glyoxalase n=1 Tax=Xanthomonas floridensis TaxID=1843580 RepID=A0A1A9MGD0_9XANT|nr:VOC family protein [Xanthomonas floridensis]MEA5126029.1 VOC family protein [Xanthomonas floridensis]MEA5133917.1 VOC family protein [Xanthomonas floridensis]OAG68697.1 glyoxalase [Xanthomonas floridensis]